jgi:leucyl-tRNA synthetase
MSKSKNNGVDPQTLIDRYGADTARLFVMFAAPPEDTLEWSDSGVEGAYRFLRRLWDFCSRNRASIAFPRSLARVTDWSVVDPKLREKRLEIHRILQQANHDYDRMQFNTVASAGMKMLNVLEKFPADAAPLDSTEPPPLNAKLHLMNEGVGILLRIIHPIVPHITSKLWQELDFEKELGNIIDAPWPQVDKTALKQDTLEIVVQVNGKLRGRIQVPANADRSETEAIALADEKVARHIAGKPVKKVIVVPSKLVNIVI